MASFRQRFWITLYEREQMQKQSKPIDGYVRECITGNEVGDYNLACNRARQLIGLYAHIEQSMVSPAGGQRVTLKPTERSATP
jgi:hypothetical protein